MSCKNCEDKPIVSYVRIDEADVEIIGCEKHLKRLIELLRFTEAVETLCKILEK